MDDDCLNKRRFYSPQAQKERRRLIGSLFAVPVLGWAAPVATIVGLTLVSVVVRKLDN
jgi:hypothetical protein